MTGPDLGTPALDVDDRAELAGLVRELAVVFGRVTLSSGKEADYYVDLRRATLNHRAAPLIGRLMRQLTEDWDYAAAGGLTLGADPVACATRKRTLRAAQSADLRAQLAAVVAANAVTGRRAADPASG